MLIRKKFKLLPNDKKFEVVSYIQETKNLTNKQMAKLLGYNPNSFSSNKSNWKKAYEEKHKEKEGDVSMHDNDSFLIAGEDEENNMMTEQKNNEEEQGIKKKVNAVDNIKLKLTENSLQQSFEINLAGKYVGDDLNSILLVLLGRRKLPLQTSSEVKREQLTYNMSDHN